MIEARKKNRGGVSKGVLGLVLVLLVAFGGFLTGRRNEERRRVAARSVPAASLPAPTPEQQAVEAAATKALVVLPVEEEVFQKFHATWGAAQERLREGGSAFSPPAQSALAVREAIIELGYDPNETILYWLSPQFAQEVAARDPAAASSTTRTVDNLLSVALGDQLADEEFAQVVASYSPAVWAAARQRRAARR